MPGDYRILLSRKVAADLQDIFEYIAARSPQNASTVIGRILEQCVLALSVRRLEVMLNVLAKHLAH